MMNRENKNVLVAYAVTVALVAVLIVVIMNANAWFFSDGQSQVPSFTPPSGGVVSQEDLRFGLFNDVKFRSLGPLLTDEERKQLEASETTPQPAEGEAATGTVKPSTGAKREVRRSNPFLPF